MLSDTRFSYAEALCDDVLRLIFLHLDVDDLFRAVDVNRRWNLLIKDPFFVYHYGLSNAVTDQSIFTNVLRKNTATDQPLLTLLRLDRFRKTGLHETICNSVERVINSKNKVSITSDRHQFLLLPTKCLAYQEWGRFILNESPDRKTSIPITLDYPIRCSKIALFEDKNYYIAVISSGGGGMYSNSQQFSLISAKTLRRVQLKELAFSISCFELTRTEAIFVDHSGVVRVFEIIYDEIERPAGTILRLPGLSNVFKTFRITGSTTTNSDRIVSNSYLDLDENKLLVACYESGKIIVFDNQTCLNLVDTQILSGDLVKTAVFCNHPEFTNHGHAILGTASGRIMKVNVLGLLKKKHVDPQIILKCNGVIEKVAVNWKFVTSIVTTYTQTMLINIDSGKIFETYSTPDLAFSSHAMI